MNKKGFTLVEILVTIGLLALIGVGIGVSLNKVLKNQDDNNYETFIEKIKSATLLYSSNSATVVNNLESKNGYVLISMNDLINGGYVREDLKNPKTDEKLKDIVSPIDAIGIEDFSQARVYFSMDKEMVVDYPFIKPEDNIYLNVINYTTMYSSNEEKLCYKGLNSSSLGLISVKDNGKIINEDSDSRKLRMNENIIAYMEDGSKCTDANLNTSKVGTYKIRYVYTVNGTNAENNPTAKSATRTVIIKPTKPSIVEFEVSPQTNNDIYLAHYTAKIKETAFEEILYCINYYDVNVQYKESINDCKSWKKLNNKNSNNEFMLDVQNVDLKKEYPGIENKELVTFYLYTKNAFEEFDYKKMTNNNEEYRLASTVLFNLEAGSSKVYLEDMKTEIQNPFEIKGIKNKTKFSQVMTDSNYGNNKYNMITRNGYYFDGWYTEKNGSGTKYTKDTTTEVFGLLNLYAFWKADSSKPTCTISASSSGLSVTNKNDNFGYPVNGSFDNSTLSIGLHTYTFIDWAGNKGSCSATISDQYSYQDTRTYWVYIPMTSIYECEKTREVEKCTGGGSTNKWLGEGYNQQDCKNRYGSSAWHSSADAWHGPGCYITVSNGTKTCEWVTETYIGECLETKYRQEEKTETYTAYDCHSGSKIEGTYKCIS